VSWQNQPGFCPSCKAASAPDATECLACGCVFEKWRAKQARGEMSAYAGKESLAQARFQPAYDVAPTVPEKSSVARRLAGAAAGAGAAGLLFWLYSPGQPAAAAPSSQDAGKGAFSYAVPAGWSIVSQDPACRDYSCVIASFRLDGPSGYANPNITLGFFDRGPESMAGSARAALEAEQAASLKNGYVSGDVGPASEITVDGLPAVKIEGTGVKRERIQLVAEASMNAQAYLRQQEAKNPGRGIYTVWAQQDPTGRNPSAYVVTQQAQYRDTESRKTDGAVLIPLRGRFLRVSYEYDHVFAGAGEAAVAEFLAGLRVKERSRPVDRLGPLKPPAQVGAMGLVMAAIFLLLT
jgi:hypothetical protein